MPRYRPELCREGCANAPTVCPTAAITSASRTARAALEIDYGRCVVCQLCTEACPTGAMAPSSDWAFGVRRREDLVWRASPAPARRPRRGPPTRAFRRSLHIRHVDAGSCNGCESELQALNNPFYNLHRLGIFFTASPRFADLLLVTGPVTYAMQTPLRAAYEAMPEPRWVMATGTCAVSGGDRRRRLCLRPRSRRGAAGRPLSARLPAQPGGDDRGVADVPATAAPQRVVGGRVAE